ncbi:MAG TPA: retropepsin-like aspartic protease [Candidatus Sulfotelmatobacter sp.]|nr:retropepsin-like aspartic protease [Candidatus Sulfotelmatobacter sp.]
MPPGPDRDYFAGVFANRAGHTAVSIELLTRVLPALRDARPDRAAIALEALADGYFKTFRYADSARAYDDLLAHFSSQLTPQKLKGTKDDAQIVQILRDSPAQTISWSGAVSLKTERNPLNSQNVELTVNGVHGPWLIDTGANISVVSKTFAEQLGLKLLAGAAETQAGLTGIENPLRVALVPTLEIGGATLHNVVVMVLDDANLHVGSGEGAYQIHAILGYPVLQALGTITFRREGVFEAGGTPPAAGAAARIYMDLLIPLLSCNVEGEDLLFSFDTGAADTNLSVLYYERFRSESRTWKKTNFEIAGAGGVVKRKLYVQPEAILGIGDNKVPLKSVSIYTTKSGTTHDDLYGNLGQDVVENFESFTLDFRAMTFTLGAPVPPTKDH